MKTHQHQSQSTQWSSQQVWTDSRDTVTQITDSTVQGEEINVSQHTIYQFLLCIGMYGHRPVRVHMLTSIHYWKCL